MVPQTVIQIEGLHTFYGKVHALQGVNLEVYRGEVFGFLGPNGAGKTTTIRCMLDLIRPSSGTVRVLGRNPRKDSVQICAQTGYLPGELHLEDGLTVATMLRYFNWLRGNPARWEDITRMAKRLDLNLRLPVRNLSKGNKQKVGLIQALMHKPALLLLDEPTVGLDPLMQQEVLQMICEARTEGATVFFSSHVLSEVQAVADRVGMIRLGKIVEVAETGEVIRRSFRRMRVRFGQTVQAGGFEGAAGVKSVLQENEHTIQIAIEGEMDAVIKALAAYPVVDMDIETPNLEEIFLAYYHSTRDNAR